MRGYTILELLIVMLLLALMTGLAIPRLDRLLSSVRSAYELEEVLARIAGLGAQALQDGREYRLVDYPTVSSRDDVAPLELPEGWRLEATKPVVYRSNGVCLGGKLRLFVDEQVVELELKPPYCRPKV